MRGRTNASNGGIFLNATTDDFEVATDNNIIAGDFVEYLYDTGVNPLNATFAGDSYLVDDTTHTYIALIGGFPTLFTYINGEITIVDTYETSSACLVMLDATHYFVFNSTTYYVGLISCTTSEITLITETASTSSVEFVRVDSTSMVYRRSNSGNLYKAYTDENYSQINIRSINMSSSFNIAGATSNMVITCTKSNSGTTYTNTFSRYNASNLTLIDTFTITTYNYGLSFKPQLLFNDRYILTYNTSKVGSSPFYYYQELRIIDTEEKRQVVSATVQNEHSGTSSLSFSQNNSSNEFIVSEEEYISSPANYKVWNYLFTFNNNLGTLTKSEKTELDNTRLTFIYYKFGEKKYGAMINNSGYQNVDITTGRVVFGTPTDTVKEWTGSGNPMGVAKQSGTAGDTIEVYIPQVNS